MSPGKKPAISFLISNTRFMIFFLMAEFQLCQVGEECGECAP